MRDRQIVKKSHYNFDCFGKYQSPISIKSRRIDKLRKEAGFSPDSSSNNKKKKFSRRADVIHSWQDLRNSLKNYQNLHSVQVPTPESKEIELKTESTNEKSTDSTIQRFYDLDGNLTNVQKSKNVKKNSLIFNLSNEEKVNVNILKSNVNSTQNNSPKDGSFEISFTPTLKEVNSRTIEDDEGTIGNQIHRLNYRVKAGNMINCRGTDKSIQCDGLSHMERYHTDHKNYDILTEKFSSLRRPLISQKNQYRPESDHMRACLPLTSFRFSKPTNYSIPNQSLRVNQPIYNNLARYRDRFILNECYNCNDHPNHMNYIKQFSHINTPLQQQPCNLNLPFSLRSCCKDNYEYNFY